MSHFSVETAFAIRFHQHFVCNVSTLHVQNKQKNSNKTSAQKNGKYCFRRKVKEFLLLFCSDTISVSGFSQFIRVSLLVFGFHSSLFFFLSRSLSNIYNPNWNSMFIMPQEYRIQAFEMKYSSYLKILNFFLQKSKLDT